MIGLRRRPVVGALLRMPAEEMVEMLAVTGHDFVVIDCEHGPADLVALRHHLAVADAHGMPVLVRPGENEPQLIQRALDQGAYGILAPHIDDSAAAEQLVRWARYAPDGQRGFATYTRKGRFGTTSPQAHQDATADTLVLAMLETPEAASQAVEILGTSGVDGYLIGSGDLAHALRHTVSEPPTLQECTDTIHRAGRAAGALRCDIVSTPEDATRAVEEGADMVIYNLAAVLVRTLSDIRAIA